MESARCSRKGSGERHTGCTLHSPHDVPLCGRKLHDGGIRGPAQCNRGSHRPRTSCPEKRTQSPRRIVGVTHASIAKGSRFARNPAEANRRAAGGCCAFARDGWGPRCATSCHGGTVWSRRLAQITRILSPDNFGSRPTTGRPFGWVGVSHPPAQLGSASAFGYSVATSAWHSGRSAGGEIAHACT